MRPFLLLATREHDQAAEEEYEAFLRCGDLTPADLIRHRLEAERLPALELDSLSGVILGGSPFTVSDPLETKSAAQLRVERELGRLLDEIVELDFPFLGACYGIGTLGHMLGATIDSTFAEPVGAVQVALNPAGRADPLLQVLPSKFEAFVGHKEAITLLPAAATALASSPTCPVQAFRVKSNVYATQFHPELDVPGIQTRIELYKHAGYFPPDQAEELKAAAGRSSVEFPPLLVRRFVELFARD